MGALISLDPASVAVEPGGEASLIVAVRNDGTVVDQFTIEVLGDGAAWAVADPPTLSLFPGTEGTARITFRPPRLASTTAGTMRFGVMVRSGEDPTGSAVAEGTLQIAGFLAPAAELVPRTSRGSRAGRHDVALDNRGNVRLEAALEGVDPDQRVQFEIDPPNLAIEPGTAGFGRVLVKPIRPFWRGPARTVPFQVAMRPDAPDAVPLLLDGTYLQEPVLPWWFMRALVAFAAILIAAVLLWLFVLQPQIRSTAAQTLEDFGFSPRPGSAAQGGGGGQPDTSAGPVPSNALTVTPPPLGGRTEVDGRLDTTNAVTPTGGTLFVTDLVFSNATGASGELTLQRTTPAGVAPLLVLRLENFRDLDLHFVTPITVRAGETLALTANCTAGATAPAPACSPAVFYSGYLEGP